MRVPLSGQSRSIAAAVMLLVPTAAAAFVAWNHVAPAPDSTQAHLGDRNQSRLADVRLFTPREHRQATAAADKPAHIAGAPVVAPPSERIVEEGQLAAIEPGLPSQFPGRNLDGLSGAYTASASRRSAGGSGGGVTPQRAVSGSSGGGFSQGGSIAAGASFSGGVSGTAATQSPTPSTQAASTVSTRAATTAPAPKAPASNGGSKSGSSNGGSSNGGSSNGGSSNGGSSNSDSSSGSAAAAVTDSGSASAAPAAAAATPVTGTVPAASTPVTGTATGTATGGARATAPGSGGGEPVLGALAPSPAATPEPLSVLLVGSGLAGLWSTRKYFR